tara:strand:+ start:903 stop:1121 length:219 start_codon:yes stop_codon:yes gene_type:complete
MEQWSAQIQGIVIFTFSLIGALLVIRFQNLKSGRKAKEDRILLKELLEKFELDVPAELQESDHIAINTIESN